MLPDILPKVHAISLKLKVKAISLHEHIINSHNMFTLRLPSIIEDLILIIELLSKSIIFLERVVLPDSEDCIIPDLCLIWLGQSKCLSAFFASKVHQLKKSRTMYRCFHHSIKDIFADFNIGIDSLMIFDLFKTCLHCFLLDSRVNRPRNLLETDTHCCSLFLLMSLNNVQFKIVMLSEFFCTNWTNNLLAILFDMPDRFSFAISMNPHQMLL